MIKQTLQICVAIGLMLTSCVANSTPLVPTSTSQPPTSTIATYQPYPKTTTVSDTEIYAGPGNLDYEILATIPAGTEVYTLGVFGDFVKVFYELENLEGYIRNEKIALMPKDVPLLNPESVPWIIEDLMVDYFSSPYTTIDENGRATFKNLTIGPGWYAPAGEIIPLGNETHLIIQMESDNGNPVSIDLASEEKMYAVGDEDQWYLGPSRLTITWSPGGYPGMYGLEFRDGLSADAFTIPLTTVGNGPFDLVIIGSNGSAIEVRDTEGKTILRLNTIGDFFFEGVTVHYPNGIFPNKSIFPSFSSMGPTTVTSNVHILKRKPIGIWYEPPTQLADLRDLAKKNGIEIIAPVEGWRLANKHYSAIVRSQVSMDYLNDTFAPIFWEGVGKYNFAFMDHMIDYKVSQGWKIMFPLVSGWGGDDPIAHPPDLRPGSFTNEEYRTILHDYVTTIACRYKDKVNLWPIAGESPGMRDNPEADFWLKRVGPDYVELSFQWVRDCDPDGALILVDTFDSPRGESMTYRLESTYSMAKEMLEKGVPIDGVGLEGHMFLPWDTKKIPTYEDVLSTMSRFTDLGLDIYITEMDVNLVPFTGTLDEKWDFEAKIYKLMLDACLDTGRCRGFGVFGIDDKHGWPNCPGPFEKPLEGYCLQSTHADPLLFDDDFSPKPAYWAIVQSLEDHQK